MSAGIIWSFKNISFYHGGKMSAFDTVVVSDWPECFVLLNLTVCKQLMQCDHATCVIFLDNMVTTSVMLYNLTTI